MPDCPACHCSLRTIRQRGGIFFHCHQCGGRAMTIPQVRRCAGDPYATALLRQINRCPNRGDLECPFCGRKMLRFESADPPLQLDACKSCGAVWFDPAEIEAVPEGAVESEYEVRMRVAEVVGRYKLEVLKERQAREAEPEPPEGSLWKTVPAVLGLPVESEVDELTRLPWVTWSLAVAVFVSSSFAFMNLESVVLRWGFVPAEALRTGGLTLLTSFFLHGGILHLLCNLYFLLVFGDNVEDYLGRWRYGLLILLATLGGDLAHWVLQSSSSLPCIGASGGISGILVIYALEFPRARIAFLPRIWGVLFLRWFHVPVWAALVFWLALQVFGLSQQLANESSVAATAHLGGAATGALLWFLWRKLG